MIFTQKINIGYAVFINTVKLRYFLINFCYEKNKANKFVFLDHVDFIQNRISVH